MSSLHRFQLNNGLRVASHLVNMTPFANIAMLYQVGSANDRPRGSGIAHMMEHLMFTGTPKVPDFDDLLQNAGGENNAFTHADYSQYFDVVPVENIDVGLFIEADRMHNLTLEPQKFKREKSVIVEEFHETCIDLPYGDIWHDLYGMIYGTHPYAVPTIGESEASIRGVKRADIQSFYHEYYQPRNAILSIVSPLSNSEIENKVRHFFGGLSEESQASVFPGKSSLTDHGEVFREVEKDVPHDAIFMGFPICGRADADYKLADVFTDILASGRSSRFFQQLYQGTDIFTHIDAYVTGSFGPGLLIIEAKVDEGYSLERAYDLIWTELEKTLKSLTEAEVKKSIEMTRSQILFSRTQGLDTALNLGFYEALGDAQLIDSELKGYLTINIDQIKDFQERYVKRKKARTLWVRKRH
jgi:predicted Zn-dependent peptidase